MYRKKLGIFLCMFLVCAFVSFLFVVQSNGNMLCPTLRFTGNWPFGPSLALVLDVERNLAFMSGGGAVYILDISNPAEPTEIQTIRTRGAACDHGTRNLFYSNGKLYIANARAGLLVWDVSTPSNPQQLGSYWISAVVRGVYVQEQYAYVAADEAGLIIIDISDPASPHKVGSFDTGGKAVGVYVRFPFAYVAYGSAGLRIIDVSSPNNPNEIASYPAIDHVRNVTVYDDYAYLADDKGGLIILDISDPYSPEKKSIYTFPTDNPDKTNHVYDVYVQGDYAYVLDFDLVILDVSNPSNPQQLSRSRLPGVASFPGWGFNVVASGNHVYVAGDMGGLAVFHVPDPQALPNEIAQFRTPGWSWDVDIEGDYAYMADDLSGLFIVDISDPKNPVEVGHHDSPSWTMGVEVEGNYAYVAARDQGLRIVDVSSPTSPFEVGSVLMDQDKDKRAYGLAVQGTHAYITDNKSTFFAVDVSDVFHPSVVDALDLDETNSNDKSQNIYIEGTYAFVAHFEHGVQIVDISDPSNLDNVGDFCKTGFSKDVWVSDGYAFVTGTEGLCVANVSNPRNPKEVGHLELERSYSVFVKDSYAFIGRHDGLCMVKVSDPANPVLVDCYPTYAYGGITDYFYSLYFVDPHVYVANGNVGLQIYEVDTRHCGRIPIFKAYHRIVIDGICDPLHEWIDAFAIDISLTDIPVMLYLAVDEIGGTLYVGIDDYSNARLDIGDYSTIFFDENNDGNWPLETGHEGTFMMSMNEAGLYTEYRSVYLEGGAPRFGSPEPFPEGVQGAMSDESGHVQIEWKIDLSESSLNTGLQETIGVYIECADGERITGVLPLDGERMAPWTFMAALVGCQNVEESKTAGNCNDGVDNDCDGDVDCLDSACECKNCEAITGNECVDNICCVIDNIYEDPKGKSTHGEYVSCVAHAADSCGLEEPAKGKIISKAAKSNVNKKKKKKDH